MSAIIRDERPSSSASSGGNDDGTASADGSADDGGTNNSDHDSDDVGTITNTNSTNDTDNIDDTNNTVTDDSASGATTNDSGAHGSRTGSRKRGRGWTRSVLSWFGVTSGFASTSASQGAPNGGSARDHVVRFDSNTDSYSCLDSDSDSDSDEGDDTGGLDLDATDANGADDMIDLDADMAPIDEDAESETVVCRLRSTCTMTDETSIGGRGRGRGEGRGEERSSLTGINMQRFLQSNGLGEYDLEGQGIESVEDLHALPHNERKRGTYACHPTSTFHALM